jgi:hypothetical protein
LKYKAIDSSKRQKYILFNPLEGLLENKEYAFLITQTHPEE